MGASTPATYSQMGSLSPTGAAMLAAPALTTLTPTASLVPPRTVPVPATKPSGPRRSHGGIGHGPGGGHLKGECKDQQCVEEECDPEECGDERRPPKDDNRICGIDRRPLLPVTLAVTTIGGAVHMSLLQFQLLSLAIPYAKFVKAFFVSLYTITLLCMAYCAFCNPGELDNADALLNTDEEGGRRELPKRAHQTWLFKSPIRRYDHYCRWLTNCIGLLNHREFVAMLIGLVTIGIVGTLVDLGLIFYLAHEGSGWLSSLLLAMHIAYSVMLTFLAGPILRLHIGFICRNELANEWKRNDFYVVTDENGKKTPVNELSDDLFNEHFEAFEYDKTRNEFDQSGAANCCTFWCTSRWDPRQLGEF
jgi:hypothetical protein